MARETRALPARRGWPERLEPYRGAGSGAQEGRWRKVQAGRPADLVGMVSHRPFPGLPGEVGMARETRALPARWGWPERLEPYRRAGSGPESAHGDSGQEGRLQGSLRPNPAAVCA